MLDLNSRVIAARVANAAITARIDAGINQQTLDEPQRDYLGASSLEHDCLRKIHWDWRRKRLHPARIARIFRRGHWWEREAAAEMKAAGFKITRTGKRLEFKQLDGAFQGHGDGRITGGPETEGVAYPCLWECKGLGSKGWKKLDKEGLAKAYPTYAAQVALYQAYLGLTENPAIFTACNVDTMELLHLLVPFDPARAQTASDRAVNIVLADRAGETLPRCTDTADDWRCNLCHHKGECWT